MTRLPRYAPGFTVLLDGRELPAELRASITSVRLADGIEGADRVELSLVDPGMRWLEHPLLAVDTPFELRMGYAPDPLPTMFVGEVTGVEANFPSGGAPTVTVVAHDFLHRLTRGTRDRAFVLNLPCIGNFPLPDPAVAALVAGGELFVPALDPVGSALSFLTLLVAYAIDPLDAQRSVRIQQGQSDFDLLTALARDNGWDLYVDHAATPHGRVLRFRFPLSDVEPCAVLGRGTTLVEFTPRISTVGQVGSVAARIWVAAIQTEFVVVLGWDYDRAAFDLQVYPGIGDVEALTGGGGGAGVLRLDVGGPATAPKKLVSELLPRLNRRLTGSGSAVGDPRLRAGRVVALTGLGERFGGLYRLTSTTHSIDGGGYRTSFEVRKEVWFGSVPVPTGGLLRVQGERV